MARLVCYGHPIGDDGVGLVQVWQQETKERRRNGDRKDDYADHPWMCTRTRRHLSSVTRVRQIALAFGVAAVSDVLSWVALFPPFDWLLDAVTALALFLILGKRWALLPGLLRKPFPAWACFLSGYWL